MSPTVSTESGLRDAVDNASPGDEIIADPGTYNLTAKIFCDTASVTIRAENDAVYGGGGTRSILTDGFGVSGGGLVELRADDIVFRGFEVTGSGRKGIEINTTGGESDWYQNPTGIEVRNVDAHNNGVWGIMTNSGSNHHIHHCDSHDQGGAGDGDGFNGTNSDGVLWEHCHAWNNPDDGFDMWSGTGHTLRWCTSTNSGPDGQAEFKLGRDSDPGGGHTVENCVAYESDEIGFSWNQERDNDVTVRNCTAYDCSPGFRFEDTSHLLENNIGYQSGTTITAAVVENNNTWNLGISDPQFVSLDDTSDDFLVPESGSPVEGAGTDGGDLGAYAVQDTSSGGIPTIGGDDVTEITIDGDVVTEITMDGDVVWTSN